MSKISRRDFFKFGWSIFTSALASNFVSKPAHADKKERTPNIVVLVCDAMSAHNLSLYGYSRKTTPNLEKIADQAFVYHNHYANGNYTTPGTASLLTGLSPWTHLAVNQAAVVRKELSEHNIFHFLGESYFKMAYTQNYWANYLLDQFSPAIDSLLPFSEFGLIDEGINNQKFKNDSAIASRALEKMLYYGNSLILSFIVDMYYKAEPTASQMENYPKGFPTSGIHHNLFTFEDLFTGIKNKITELDALETPFFSYFHIFPPHHPYRPQKDFVGIFDNDGYQSIAKHEHVLSAGVSQPRLDEERNNYDAYVANLDMEIGKLITELQKNNILDHTYFVITSDHGEMFERGLYGHNTSLLYDPVIKIPLMILAPGNTTRQDFFVNTSNIDLVPTILNIAGLDVPASIEGQILPGFGGSEDPKRAIFAVCATESSVHYTPFSKATYTIIKDNFKLHYYHGYQNKYQDFFEFYDLREDPEELHNKSSKPKFAGIISELKDELFKKIGEQTK